MPRSCSGVASRLRMTMGAIAPLVAVANWIPLPSPLEQDLRTRSPVAGEAETRMTEKASAYIDLERCFRWTDGKGCHGPVNNSLTKLDRLPLDPTLLQRVPFLARRGAMA